jgi:protein phosphatase
MHVENPTNIPNADGSGYRVATRTHIGLKRRRNEDFLGVESTPLGMLLVVCDGMGGHAGGDRASRLAVSILSESVSAGEGFIDERLRMGVQQANSRIYHESRTLNDARGMGTTLVAAVIVEGSAVVANVGDSRAYLLHAGRLRRVTVDHSVVGELVASGEITEEQAAQHPRRNLITRAIGTDPRVEADLFRVILEPGDLLLLSTDGLHGLVSDARIQQLLLDNESPDRACDALIEEALAAGGDDNISVAVARIGPDGNDGGPLTDPGTMPPQNIPDEKRIQFIPWIIIVMGLAALTFWGLQEFGIMRSADGIDSTHILSSDSMLIVDSLGADSLQSIDSLRGPDTMRFGGDSLAQPTPGDEVGAGGSTGRGDGLSGSFGSSRRDTTQRTPRQGRR